MVGNDQAFRRRIARAGNAQAERLQDAGRPDGKQGGAMFRSKASERGAQTELSTASRNGAQER